MKTFRTWCKEYKKQNDLEFWGGVEKYNSDVAIYDIACDKTFPSSNNFEKNFREYYYRVLNNRSGERDDEIIAFIDAWELYSWRELKKSFPSGRERIV